MKKPTYIKLDRYGLFGYNKWDLEQMNEMADIGYEIYKETFLRRIYKLKKNKI